jgi:GNAT superfamily N-acetyltransferase
VTIRTVRVHELPLLQEIERAAGRWFADLGMRAVADDEPLPVDVLDRYRKAGRAWVAVDASDTPVAYLVADRVDEALHIEQVTVHPDHARRGLGRALIERLERHAAAEGVPALTLTTFAEVPWNAPYYARLGFAPLAEEDWGPELREARRREAAHGLDAWPRLAMRRAVATDVLGSPAEAALPARTDRPEPTARLAEAVRLREAGEPEKAQGLLLALSAEFPGDARIAYQTAWAHDVLGLEAEAVPFYERAVARPGLPGEPGLTEEDRRGALLGLGSTYRVLGRHAEAVRVLRQGVAEFPDDGALRTFLAMALYNTGDHHEAMALLLRLLAATSEDPGVRAYRRAIGFYAADLGSIV